MLVHLLQMILNFMYVCQSVCLLTSLPKLDKGISPVLDDIPEMLVHWLQIILIFCMSISLVVGILPYKYRNISCSGPDVGFNNE